jgi:hypothetical protein
MPCAACRLAVPQEALRLALSGVQEEARSLAQRQQRLEAHSFSKQEAQHLFK